MALLKRDGTMVVVGAVEPMTKVNGVPFIFRRRSMAGSLIGGIARNPGDARLLRRAQHHLRH